MGSGIRSLGTHHVLRSCNDSDHRGVYHTSMARAVNKVRCNSGCGCPIEIESATWYKGMLEREL